MSQEDAVPRFALGDALVLSPPGLGPITTREARRVGIDARLVSGDRRADVLTVAVAHGRAARVAASLRTAESVLIGVGRLDIRATATATAAALDRDAVQRAHALSLRATRSGGLRVVVRLTDERRFLRTQLRGALERQLGHLHDGRDDADELWVIQTSHRTIHVGVRGHGSSRRAVRSVERPGALRPAIAAGMLVCAGSPRRLLDPCCGSGTILAEAAAVGASSVGADIDRGAVAAAAVNTASPVLSLDARRLPFAADSFDAVVSNLPFGHQHHLQGTAVAWYRRALGEALRVAETVVVLAPTTTPFRQALGRTRADLVERHDVDVLGRRATIWVLRRR